ncbi:MAG: CRISPR-associated helicase Cas3' [Bacteroidota bacterium]
MDNKPSLFRALIGKDADPYPYQLRVADRLAAGGSVLLSAPTGAGKTWAALLGFLAGYRTGSPHADRVLYALPLRSLATGLYRSTSAACARVTDWGPDDRPSISIQTGEEKEDPFFTGDVVFTTIDQLLAGYLQIPLSLPTRLANINAGALVGCLAVLDEVHLLDPARSLATVMEMGRRLREHSRFLLMTATLSRPAREALAEFFCAALEGPTEDELAAMPAQAGKERRYHWRPEALTAEAVLERHNRGRSLVICNTVRRAQELFGDLVKLKQGDTGVFLLHSRFLPEDRKANEDMLAPYFGPDAESKDAILVATQVVEAGIDISAENLHTELCPANALVQRAGRCARFAARNKGDVYVYELPPNRKGGRLYLPYEEREIDATRKALAERDGGILRFADEQELVDRVHAGRELDLIKANRRNVQSTLRRRVLNAMTGNDRAAVSDLIRDVDSVGIMVEENPKPVDLLGGLLTIPVPRTSIYGIKDLLLGDQVAAWVPVGRKEDDEYRDLADWRPVRDEVDLKTAWLMVLSPRVAGYGKETGLQLGEPGEATGIAYKARELRPATGYECETYHEHIERCLRALAQFRRGAAHGRLAESYGWQGEDLEKLLTLAAGLHDLGKLSHRWQRAIQAWQYENYPAEGAAAKGRPLGHSTYRPKDGDAEKSRDRRYDRGTHAGEGAAAACPLLIAAIRDLFEDEEDQYGALSTALSAIARHHSPRVDSIEEYRLIPEAGEVVRESLAGMGVEVEDAALDACPDQRRRHEIARMLVGYDDSTVAWLPLYWHLVRLVRLADHEAVRMLLQESEGGEES